MTEILQNTQEDLSKWKVPLEALTTETETADAAAPIQTGTRDQIDNLKAQPWNPSMTFTSQESAMASLKAAGITFDDKCSPKMFPHAQWVGWMKFSGENAESNAIAMMTATGMGNIQKVTFHPEGYVNQILPKPGGVITGYTQQQMIEMGLKVEMMRDTTQGTYGVGLPASSVPYTPLKHQSMPKIF